LKYDLHSSDELRSFSNATNSKIKRDGNVFRAIFTKKKKSQKEEVWELMF